MTIGASTSNLYPALTEEALDRLLKLGFRELEVFVNTESELDPAFIAMLREKAEGCGAASSRCHRTSPGLSRICFFPNTNAGCGMVCAFTRGFSPPPGSWEPVWW